jgi:hypothetical protein
VFVVTALVVAVTAAFSIFENSTPPISTADEVAEKPSTPNLT